MMELYRKKTKKGYLTVWYFTYMYQDDLCANKDWSPYEQHYVGTIEEFEEERKFDASNYGANYWNIEKRHATEKEYSDYRDGYLIY